ncbi:MAG TPA: biopolymer transporter ExbD [Phycisphaerales bacterium]|nr:biopolymer transporter ExbD [Phycisphaerales bacterium]|tara:strand:+ start:1401 stop:1814 length:414 start_codon:yes stop_codon:yes gene_type:complete
MFSSMQHRKNNDPPLTVDMAPLIDVVFILLIFFLVTATFVRETGIEVNRPQATAATSIDQQAMRISITVNGTIFTDGSAVDLDTLHNKINTFVASHPSSPIIVIPDQDTRAQRVVEVMDAAKLAGAEHVAIATEKKG